MNLLLAAAEATGLTAAQRWEFVRGIALLIVFVAIAGWVGFRALRKSENPWQLVFKWVASLVMGWVTFFVVGPFALQNPFVGVPLAAACGIVFAILWRGSIIEAVVKPFTGMFDGGDEEPEPRPAYSIAIAKRKQGRFSEALHEISAQVEKFPRDFEGQFLAAEIAAENLNDLDMAAISIDRLCNQHGHSQGSIAMALNALADWRLKYAQDRDGAKAALERIIELFPNTDLAALAAQRIGHLARTENLVEAHDRHRYVVRPGVENLGLHPNQRPMAPEEDWQQRAVACVKHLEAHPLDMEVREELASLYARRFQRLDLAREQLEQMIALPHVAASRAARWLHMLADLQIEAGGTFEAARETLQRIVDRDPNGAAAEVARNRIAHLKLSFRKKEQSQTVKLGSYEQDIGLKIKRDPP